MGVSKFELELAQARSTEYVRGLEEGHAAAREHELLISDVVSVDDISIIYDGLLKRKSAENAAHFRGEINKEFLDTDGALAMGMGTLTGVIEVLRKREEGVAA